MLDVSDADQGASYLMAASSGVKGTIKPAEHRRLFFRT